MDETNDEFWEFDQLHPLLIHGVLDIIIRKLPSRDLLSARLTCKLWDEYSIREMQKRSNLVINFSQLKRDNPWSQQPANFLNILESIRVRNIIRNFKFDNFKDFNYFMNYFFTMNNYQNGQQPPIIEGIHLDNINNCPLNTLATFLSALSQNLKSFSISVYRLEKNINIRSILPIQIEFPQLQNLEIENMFEPFFLIGKISKFPPSLKYLKLVIDMSNQIENDEELEILKDSLTSMNLASVREFQLSISINDSSYNFEKYLTLFEQVGLKVTTLSLYFEYRVLPETNLVILLREFSRFEKFLQVHSNTLQELKLIFKSVGILRHIGIPEVHQATDIIPFDLLPVMPNLKKLKYIIRLRCQYRSHVIPVVPLNLQLIAPKIKVFETRSQNFQLIAPVVDEEFQRQFSYNIIT